MCTTDALCRIEFGFTKIDAVIRAMEDAFPLYDRNEEELERLYALVSILQDEVSMLEDIVSEIE